MYSKTAKTKLGLARWAELMGINPIHFAGVQLDGDGSTPDMQNALGCSQPWVQYSWQGVDRESRESVAQAIELAERNIEAVLGYSLLATWHSEELVNTVRPYQTPLVNLNLRDIRNYPKAVQTRWGMFITGGIRAVTTIDEDAAIVYSDADGDGYDETATVTAATTVTDTEEIRVYYPDHVGDDHYEIRPITVAIAGGVATITFARHHAVLESRDEALVWATSTGDVDANFLTAVDVARVYNDPSTMATLTWEPTDFCGCDAVGGGSCALCQYSVQTACLVGREHDLGWVAYKPATWDATNEDWDEVNLAVARDPDLIRLYYRAGLVDNSLDWPTRQMDPHWEKAVAYYAASMLDRGVCDCASNFVAHWQEDLAIERGPEQFSTYKIAAKTIRSKFGTRRGAIYALERVTEPNAPIHKNAVLVS